MDESPDVRHHQVIVIGGGQAGLAVGHLLKERELDLIILDAERTTGDQWRRRWNSLRLFTPARHDGLPGYPFPGNGGSFPDRDMVAAYLAEYSERFDLPVVHDARATRVERRGAVYRVVTDRGEYAADAVVIATGACAVPFTPEFAAHLDPSIEQIHSHAYVSSDTLPPGTVLVVGYGTSGAEIAEELSASGREVTIAGKPTASPPEALLRVAGGAWWFVLNHVLSLRTPVGRKVAPRVSTHGAPLIRISPQRVRAAGVREVGRLVGVKEGRPLLADGSTVSADVIIWCTGYRGDFTWVRIDGLSTDSKGYVEAPFGFPAGVDGLAFLGMPFQSKLASPLLGGVGDDARRVADRIAGFVQLSRPGAPRRAAQPSD
jgi:putative flavoprotein involved in K+ transport